MVKLGVTAWTGGSAPPTNLPIAARKIAAKLYADQIATFKKYNRERPDKSTRDIFKNRARHDAWASVRNLPNQNPDIVAKYAVQIMTAKDKHWVTYGGYSDRRLAFTDARALHKRQPRSKVRVVRWKNRYKNPIVGVTGNSAAEKYVRSIRNERKRIYATAVYRAYLRDADAPEPVQLSTMAAQAVRMRLRELMR
jgi:hypothetical protein